MSIALRSISKRFGGTSVVRDISLDIPEGQLFVMLGGSGSGKSTLLRIIAGLTEPDQGEVHLHGRSVVHLPPQKRGVGFVFQNYSLFRHMTVAQNVAFPLKLRRVAPEAQRARAEELLHLVDMGGLGERMPDQLSGGQRQRVALARALAHPPEVLLLDEPFGALDAKIRVQLRRTLRDIQQRLGTTTVLVTHDQEEAFDVADRIAVIHQGRLVEEGDPETLYRHPRSLFAATFLGSAAILSAPVQGGQAHLGQARLPYPRPLDPAPPPTRTLVMLRPEDLALDASREAAAEQGPVIGQGRVLERAFAGSSHRLRVSLARPPELRVIAPRPAFGASELVLEVQGAAAGTLHPGDACWVAARRFHLMSDERPRVLVIDLSGEAAPTESAERLAADLDAEVTRVAPPSLERWAVRLGAARQDLVVVLEPPGADRRAPERQAFLERALRPGAAPLLLLRGPRAQFRSLMVCTAAGEPGKADVRAAAWLAQRLGAAVTLLHVSPAASALDTIGSAPTRDHLQRALEVLQAEGQTAELRIRAAARPVEGILAEVAERDPDLLILGARAPGDRGYGGQHDVTRLLMDSLERPLLIVPEGER